MVVCQFYLRGQCRFGNACRNEHPKDAVKSDRSGQPAFTAESIKKDLTPDDGKPLWPLSSYGCAKGEKTFISGLDESPEELRFIAWQASRSGDPTQLEGYKSYEAKKIAVALAAHKNGEMNYMDAFKAAFEASRAQPAAFGGGDQPSTSFTSPFGQPSSSVSAFGQPPSTSPFGQPKSIFGQSSSRPSAFGQASNTSSAFGQSFSTTTASAFGPGGVGSSKSTSAFGQPTFGQPSQPVSPFSKPAAASTFGQSAFRQPVFGQPALPAAFAAPAASATPAFGQSPFGRSSGGFGTPSFGPSQSNQGPSQTQTQTQAGDSGGFSAFVGKPASFGQPVGVFGASNTGPLAFGTGSTSQAGPFTAPPANPSIGISPAPTLSLSDTLPSISTSEMDEEASSAIALSKLASQSFNFSSSNDPYATILPENYKDIVPRRALDAFESPEFSWGYVPEWVPPMNMR